jgi:hypothetical protein
VLIGDLVGGVRRKMDNDVDAEDSNRKIGLCEKKCLSIVYMKKK